MGRYLEPDPIALAGGFNTEYGIDWYGYAVQNPLSNSDPTGLTDRSQLCESLANRIQNIERKIAQRIGELDEDPQGLPETCPADKQNPSLSRSGHRMLINKDKAQLAVLKAQYALMCGNFGPPPFSNPFPFQPPVTNPYRQNQLPQTSPMVPAAGTAGALGTAAVILLIIILLRWGCDPMRDPETILDEIRAAGQLGNDQSLEALFLELGAAVLVFPEFPDDFFVKIVALLEDASFLPLEASWNLVYFIDGNWELLSESQRAQLRGTLSSLFGRHRNYMGAFLIGEMLGRQYADEDALAALVRLSKTAQMPALALVPHGLETLARSTGDARLRDRAVQRLHELANSSVDEVRKEAGISLGKIGRK